MSFVPLEYFSGLGTADCSTPQYNERYAGGTNPYSPITQLVQYQDWQCRTSMHAAALREKAAEEVRRRTAAGSSSSGPMTQAGCEIERGGDPSGSGAQAIRVRDECRAALASSAPAPTPAPTLADEAAGAPAYTSAPVILPRYEIPRRDPRQSRLQPISLPSFSFGPVTAQPRIPGFPSLATSRGSLPTWAWVAGGVVVAVGLAAFVKSRS